MQSWAIEPAADRQSSSSLNRFFLTGHLCSASPKEKNKNKNYYDLRPTDNSHLNGALKSNPVGAHTIGKWQARTDYKRLNRFCLHWCKKTTTVLIWMSLILFLCHQFILYRDYFNFFQACIRRSVSMHAKSNFDALTLASC